MFSDEPKSTLTSLRFRERLSASTPEKEAELMAYLSDQGGEAVIDGYRVTSKDGRLAWEKLPQAVTRQLSLFPEEKGGIANEPI